VSRRIRRIATALVALGLGTASAAYAHEGGPLAPHDLWRAWSLDPGIILPLALAGWLYASGTRALWRQAGAGHGIRRWQAAAFAAGWITLAVALVSPLHALGETLFSAHMAQHELLMVVAAPLVVLGRPVLAFLWGLPMAWRRTAGRWAAVPPLQAAWGVLTLPSIAWLVHAVAIWAWHAPRLYDAALTSDLVHALQHASFLGSALLFWWALIHGRHGRLRYGASVLYVFTTAVHTTALGAVLALASRPLYPGYTATGVWGLTPLEDQQLAGLIMWVPAAVAYLIAALALMTAWLQESERRAVRSETHAVALRGAA
jgi:Predicted membrane protein